MATAGQRKTFEVSNWGRSGFDAGNETQGACREGSDSRKSITVTFIVANDENYALA
ncbi:MAG: hypothetical protein ACI9R8_000892, partial [Candidatus Paceibacteria bacterium]